MSTPDRRLTYLEAEVKRLRQGLAQRIIKPPKGSSLPKWHLRIVDGQTVFSSGATTYYGITRSGSQVTTVPSLYDPTSVGSTAGLFTAVSGIGRAFLAINGVEQANLVLVVHDNRTGAMITHALIETNRVESVTLVSIPLASDATQSVQAYVPLFR